MHISELANRYVKDASDIVKAGQIVKVKVLSADPKTKRIALSMKALQGPAPRRPLRPQQKPEAAIEDKLAMLASKWKTR
jgi:uncharacterized protein